MATDYPASPRQRDVLDALWRLFSSAYLTRILVMMVALALFVAAVLPQQPEAARSDGVARSQWLALVHHRYPTTGEALLAVGALDVFHSLWFRLLLALLTFNLCLDLVNLTEAIWQSRRAPAVRRPESFFSDDELATSWLADVPWDEALEVVRRALTVTVARPREEHAQGVAYFHADSGSWPSWGTLALRVGVLLMIVSWLVSGWFGWQTEAIRLGVGQQTVTRGASSMIRLDGLTVENGDFRAEVVLVEDDGQEAGRGMVTARRPLRGGGLTVRCLGYGPAVVVQAIDEAGRPLMLQSFVEGAELEETVYLSFGAPGEERYFAAPERNLVVRLVLVAGEDVEVRPAFRVQAYRSSSVRPVFEGSLPASDQVEIAGDRYVMEVERYALLQAGYDPGAGLVILGLLLACGGMILVVWKPRAQVWVLVAVESGGITVRARGEMWAGDQRFARLVAVLERALAAPKAGGDGDG
ncbi:MAG: cytochrome c biogenesis protein ResB [Chloroflexota bacterium]|nr:cytochrome c biogenesis protein ResB [Chloroflexota bacterium]